MNGRLLYERVLVVLFCAPIFLSALRKATAGMPAMIEALEYPIIVICMLVFAFSHRRVLPFNRVILISICAILFSYALGLMLSIQYGIKFTAVSFLSRVLPIFLVLLARKEFDLHYVVKRTVYLYVLFGLIMLPFGFVAFVLGNYALPDLFAPTQGMLDMGKEYRFGLPVYYGLFYSNVVLSWTYWSVGVLCLFMIEWSLGRRSKIELVYALGFVLSFVIVLLAGKRLPLLALGFGGMLCALKMLSGRKGFLYIAVLLNFTFAALAGLLILDNASRLYIFEGVNRSLFQAFSGYTTHIITEILWPRLELYGQILIGSGLGTAGPEARYLLPNLWLSHYYVPEMGVAMLLIELGFFLTVFVVSVKSLIALRMITLWKTEMRQLVLFSFMVIVFFLLKELNILVGSYLHIVLFWFFLGLISVRLSAGSFYR